jgi:hypothetical protein
MATIDDEIDALYAGPLSGFTDARNALAKRGGTRAAEIRTLAKPNAAAWAVNQLFWHARPVFDALVEAAQAKRDAVVRQLGGKAADAASAETRHRAALEKAVAAATGLLTAAGDPASPATLEAVRQTLDAVPSPDVNGRLTRPLEAVGFSMLSSLMTSAGGVRHTRAPADVVVMKRPAREDTASSKKAAEAARRASEERKRERAKVARAFDAAKAREREATSAFTRAKRAVDKAEASVVSLETQLANARSEIGDRHEDADRARLTVNDAAAARVALERQLKEFD